jgi:hypothetical protein
MPDLRYYRQHIHVLADSGLKMREHLCFLGFCLDFKVDLSGGPAHPGSQIPGSRAAQGESSSKSPQTLATAIFLSNYVYMQLQQGFFCDPGTGLQKTHFLRTNCKSGWDRTWPTCVTPSDANIYTIYYDIRAISLFIAQFTVVPCTMPCGPM